MDFADSAIRKAEGVRGLVRQIGDEDVGVGKKAFHPLTRLKGTKVQRHAPLVGVQVCELSAGLRVERPARKWPGLSRCIALRSFNLDDVRSEIGQCFSAHRAGNPCAVLNYIEIG